MHNFDEERAKRFSRERSFQIGGEVFKFRLGLHPDTFNEIMAPYNSITVLTPGAKALEAADETIKRFLESDEDRERWDKLRSELKEESTNTDDPTEMAITSGDMRRVIEWMIEEQTGHPTNGSSSSRSGRRPSTPKSTESSSSQAAA